MALIYGEIDAAVPDISLDAVSEFIRDSKEQHISLGHSKEEEVYFERNNREYPWNRRILQFKNRKFYNYNLLDPFKEVYKVIEQLPIRDEDRIVLLLQQNQQPAYDFNFHFDNDNPFGFRICFGLDTNKVFLEQSRIKSEFKQHALELKRIEDTMVEDRVYKITPLKSNTVFILNGHEYPHRVPVDNNLQRAVLVVRGKLESLNSLKFLQKEEQ